MGDKEGVKHTYILGVFNPFGVKAAAIHSKRTRARRKGRSIAFLSWEHKRNDKTLKVFESVHGLSQNFSNLIF